MDKKKCNHCQIEKKLCEFHKNKNSKDGHKTCCKLCVKIKTKKNYSENKEKLTELRKKFRKENTEKIKKYRKKEWEKNKNKIKEKTNEWRRNNKDKLKLYNKKYRAKNKIKIIERERNYQNNKYKNDLKFKISKTVRGRIYDFLTTKKIRKKCKTFEIIGCTPQELKNYLETKFLNDMSWDNYGVNGWHIDHIIPLASAKDENEIYKLCHYTNLQPLWATENLSKSDKLIV
jgi:hypothetical protein